MNFIINIIIIAVTSIVTSFIFGMIILSAFFGIPQTIKLKKKNILLESASIKPYLITILLWLSIILIVLLCLYNILNKEFFIAVIIGMVFAIFNSFKSLSKDNYQINMDELLRIQSNHFNPDFINFFNNGIDNVFLEKAEEIAKLRGFNNWNELEELFIRENNVTEDLNKMTIEERFNYIANIAGVNDFNELYNVCIEEIKSTKN